jgi:ABC-2 type transport system ATP-binding protein
MRAPILSAAAPDAALHPMVRVEGLVRRYGQRTALAGVSFTVASGERVALLGPNGSGKSTLLRTLATLLRPSEGRAGVDGHDVAREADAVRRRLGTAFQSPSLDGKLTVRENLRFQGWLYGLSGAALAARMDELLTRFSVADRAGDRVETLSGGLKRRVELAKTLLHRPSVLLLDEPSTGLDPAARLEFWELLGAYQQTHGLTVIAATHLLDEAERCTRVALLDRGQLVALDSPDALKARVGGLVVTVEATAPETLIQPIRERYAIAAAVSNGRIHLAPGVGLEIASRLLADFPREVQAVRLGRPSLEDAFLVLTGHTIGATEEHLP